MNIKTIKFNLFIIIFMIFYLNNNMINNYMDVFISNILMFFNLNPIFSFYIQLYLYNIKYQNQI